MSTFVHVTYAVPDNLVSAFLNGSIRLTGGVLRTQDGRIIKHLKPAKPNAVKKSEKIGKTVLKFANQHKGITTIAGIAAVSVAITCGKLAYNKLREPKAVTSLKKALKAYMDAMQTGRMDIGKINNLMDALEALKQEKNYDKLMIQLSANDFENIITYIYGYTFKLAEANNFALSENNLHSIGTPEKASAIVSLQNHLEIQKKIIESAA